MGPEVGFFCLILAFFLGMGLMFLPFLKSSLTINGAVIFARKLEIVQLLLIGGSFLLLEWAFFHDDFSVLYVYQHSNTLLPWYYKLTALWGGHEGSLLLWILLLCAWVVLAQKNNFILPLLNQLWMSTTLGFISTGFLGFILFTSNPFQRALPFPPQDGVDLNPMLQDPGLIIHPPILYMGYVGFAIGFAFAISVLITNKYQSKWVSYLQPLVLISWAFLTAGITLGSWWAYYELGWGGWWFWDPVENASLMPWLIGAALIHVLPAVEKRSLFKRWSLILLILGFLLSLLGTFLVRSGVLTSVHAFANDPKRGVYILIYLSVMTFIAMFLYLRRIGDDRDYVKFSVFSRESLLFINNILLVSICLTVVLGTLYPIALDWLNLGKISVGPPYFNTVVQPLGLMLLIFMLLAPRSRWLKLDLKEYYFLLFEGGLLLLLLVSLWDKFIFVKQDIIFYLSLFLAVCLIVEHLWCFIINIFSNNRSNKLGMLLAHLGFVMMVLGIIIVSQFSIEQDLNLQVGEAVNLSNYKIKFSQIFPIKGANYTGVQAKFILTTKHDMRKITLFPERRVYTVTQMPMSKTAINIGLFRDIYIALSNPVSPTRWMVRIYYKPFVRWLWLGGIIMFIGGMLAIAERRFLVKSKAQEDIKDLVTA